MSHCDQFCSEQHTEKNAFYLVLLNGTRRKTLPFVVCKTSKTPKYQRWSGLSPQNSVQQCCMSWKSCSFSNKCNLHKPNRSWIRIQCWTANHFKGLNAWISKWNSKVNKQNGLDKKAQPTIKMKQQHRSNTKKISKILKQPEQHRHTHTHTHKTQSTKIEWTIETSVLARSTKRNSAEATKWENVDSNANNKLHLHQPTKNNTHTHIWMLKRRVGKNVSNVKVVLFNLKSKSYINLSICKNI